MTTTVTTLLSPMRNSRPIVCVLSLARAVFLCPAYTNPISTDQMVKLLGQGTFGKVVQARHKKDGHLVAIKIIRAVQKYRDASRIELRVLRTLKANDAENRNRCIHLRDCFDFRGHICIVMDLLGSSVFDFLKSNNFVPFPNSQIHNFARQLFTSVACTSHENYPEVLFVPVY